METQENGAEAQNEEVESSVDHSTERVQELEDKLDSMSQILEDQKKWNESLAKKMGSTEKETLSKPTQEPSQDTAQQDRLNTLENTFSLSQEGYSLAEAKDIMDIAKAKNIPLTEAKELPIVKAGIEAVRLQAVADEKTPDSKGNSVQAVKEQTKSVFANAESTEEQKRAAFKEMTSKVRDKQSHE